MSNLDAKEIREFDAALEDLRRWLYDHKHTRDNGWRDASDALGDVRKIEDLLHRVIDG